MIRDLLLVRYEGFVIMFWLLVLSLCDMLNRGSLLDCRTLLHCWRLIVLVLICFIALPRWLVLEMAIHLNFLNSFICLLYFQKYVKFPHYFRIQITRKYLSSFPILSSFFLIPLYLIIQSFNKSFAQPHLYRSGRKILLKITYPAENIKK